MKLLLTSATRIEIQPFIDAFPFTLQNNNLLTLKKNEHELTVFVSGVGMPSVIYSLTKLLNNHYFDAALNVGIAGHYGSNLTIGNLVTVESERFADLGVNNQGSFVNLFDLGFVKANEYPFSNGKLIAPELPSWAQNLTIFPRVDGLTVNTGTGTEEITNQLSLQCPQGVETMENAAFFYVCLMEHLPFVSIRSVSNKVELRNPSAWNIPLAVRKLNDALIKLVESL